MSYSEEDVPLKLRGAMRDLVRLRTIGLEQCKTVTQMIDDLIKIVKLAGGGHTDKVTGGLNMLKKSLQQTLENNGEAGYRSLVRSMALDSLIERHNDPRSREEYEAIVEAMVMKISGYE